MNCTPFVVLLLPGIDLTILCRWLRSWKYSWSIQIICGPLVEFRGQLHCHFDREKEGDMKSVLVRTLLVTFILQIAFNFQDARVRYPNVTFYITFLINSRYIGMLACTCKFIPWPSLQTFADELLTYKHNSIQFLHRLRICVKYFLSSPRKNLSPEKTETN